MRKSSGKSALLPVLENHLKPSYDLPNESENTSYVMDDGYLLHLCFCQRHETHVEIVSKYVSYLQLKNEYFRHGYSSEVLVVENSFAVLPPDMLLYNASNKTQLITLLSIHLRKSGVNVVQAESDADTLLVLNAVSKGKLRKTTILVGEDTDLVLLLVAHSEGNTYMLIPSKGKRARKVFHITQHQEVLGSMKDYMLFIHAFTGCDTTLHGKGKSLQFVKLNKVTVFNDKSSSLQEVAEAGEAFMCVIYGGKPSENNNNTSSTLKL
ncbi:hypothetical protein PR048_018506 [Dryococelus australis]|uniref:Uncharacterized protein n=1 Tax=Dryococelus australis TaxID=614101 RepID=A0ABQ9HCI6_9NEOP|nr:hypothetical protein PR048_018506 [Dryococelus australis]